MQQQQQQKKLIDLPRSIALMMIMMLTKTKTKQENLFWMKFVCVKLNLNVLFFSVCFDYFLMFIAERGKNRTRLLFIVCLLLCCAFGKHILLGNWGERELKLFMRNIHQRTLKRVRDNWMKVATNRGAVQHFGTNPIK